LKHTAITKLNYFVNKIFYNQKKIRKII